MEPFTNASLSQLAPPSLQDVRDLAKAYLNSSELLRSSSFSIEEIPNLPSPALRINTHTIILSTKLPLLRFFPDHMLMLQRHLSGPYYFMVLDLQGFQGNLAMVEHLLTVLPPRQRIAVHKDWRNALFKAMMHEARVQHRSPANEKV